MEDKEDGFRKAFYQPFRYLGINSENSIEVLQGYTLIGECIVKFFKKTWNNLQGSDISDCLDDCPADYIRRHKLH